MRIISTAVLLLAAVSFPATAEPPPQATAAAPSITASDANYVAATDSIVVRGGQDTLHFDSAGTLVQKPVASTTSTRTHSRWFWVGILVVVLLIVAGAWRYFTRGPTPTEPLVSDREAGDRASDRYRRGGGGGQSNT